MEHHQPLRLLRHLNVRLLHRMRWGIFEVLCLFTALSTRGTMPEAPHKGAKICLVIGGKLRGLLLAHPLGHVSPGFVLGSFEPHIPQTLARYSGSGAVIYDIGANIGYHTLMFARCVEDNGCVVSFEPNPVDMEILRWNVLVNSLTNVRLVDSAISDLAGVVEFATFDVPGIHHISTGTEPSDAKIIAVTAVTLDDYIYAQGNPAPSFVKIDVEGAENRVLRGGLRMLREYKPIVIVEVWPKNRQEVMGIMLDCGYCVSEEHAIYGDGISDIVYIPKAAASGYQCKSDYSRL
jgi:FkbM family methyltransferase